MKNYFYTNAQLGTILCPDGCETVIWPNFGFTTNGVSRAVQAGFQQGDEDGNIRSLLPIDDQATFNETLGYLVVKGTNEYGEFFRVITEAEAIAERDRLKAANEAKAAAEAKNAPMSDSEKLDLLIEAQADLIGGAV